MSSPDPSLRTVYLGQFDEERAERIAEGLEAAGIPWHFKQFGRISRLFFADSWGVRMFVDSRRIDEVREIVSRTAQADS